MFPSNADIRKFIQSCFSDSELETFCFDYFPEVSDELTVGMLKSNKVLLLLEYCQRRQLMANLLAALRKERPKSFDNEFSPLSTLSENQQDFQLSNMTDQVFICYASEDLELASRLVNSLKIEGYRVWIAPESIHPGEKWVTAINRGLEESDIFILLITEAAVNSKWVGSEVDAAIDMDHRGEIRIIPLLLQICSLPPLWRSYQHIIFWRGFEGGWLDLLSELRRPDDEFSEKKTTRKSNTKKLNAVMLDNSKLSSIKWMLPKAYKELVYYHKPEPVAAYKIRLEVEMIEDTLASLNAPATVVEINGSPSVIQYLVEPSYYETYDGYRKLTRYEEIEDLSIDLAVSLVASNIQIYPLLHRGLVAIDVPNPAREIVGLRDVIESSIFREVESNLKVVLGLNTQGKAMVTSMSKLQNLLIAGRPGSGRSVLLDAIIAGLLLQNTPEDLRLLLIDSRFELANYQNIPHLVNSVETSSMYDDSPLKWALNQVELRLLKFQERKVTHFSTFNLMMEDYSLRLPCIFILINELSDLVIGNRDTHRIINYIAGTAHLTGIHVVALTRNPVTEVITDSILSNFPSRLVLTLKNKEESIRLIGRPGAEKLLGKGDMIAALPKQDLPVRIQGPYISDAEIENIVEFWSQQSG